MTIRVFGYLFFYNYHAQIFMILFLRFLLNFSFDWENVSKTLFDLISKHLEFR